MSLSLIGKIAYPGKVSGKAIVFRANNDFAKFIPKNILVITNSNPALVPYIANSIGCIGENNSICCHLAIVAREFGIPCVVGVKNVTKIIMSGDSITLDAYSGKVIYGKKKRLD